MPVLSSRRSFLLCTCWLATLCTAGGGAYAQGLFTPTASDQWQATLHNPALYTNLERTVTVGLPGVSDRLDLGGFTYDEVVVIENGGTYWT